MHGILLADQLALRRGRKGSLDALLVDGMLGSEARHGSGGTANVVERVFKAIGMELGLRKCAVAHMVEHDIQVEDHTLPEERVIGSLTQGDVYRFLGIEQMFKPSLRTIKERVKRTYLQIMNLKFDKFACSTEPQVENEDNVLPEDPYSEVCTT